MELLSAVLPLRDYQPRKELLSGLGVTSCGKRKKGQRRWLRFPLFFFLFDSPCLISRCMIHDAQTIIRYIPCYMSCFLSLYSSISSWLGSSNGQEEKKNYSYTLRTLNCTSLSSGKSENTKAEKKYSLEVILLIFFGLAALHFYWNTGKHSDTASIRLQLLISFLFPFYFLFLFFTLFLLILLNTTHPFVLICFRVQRPL